MHINYLLINNIMKIKLTESQLIKIIEEASIKNNLEEDFNWDDVLYGQHGDNKYDKLEKEFADFIVYLQEKYSKGKNKIGHDSYEVIDVMKQLLPRVLENMFPMV